MPTTRRRRKKRQVSGSLTIAGVDLLNWGNDPDDGSDIFGGDFLPGGGMTNADYDKMTVKIANMTIGDLLALVDTKNVDPLVAVELAKELRKLMLTLIDEVVEAITSGSAGDLFKSFDFKLGGVIQVPRKTRRFFEVTFSFLIGGLLHIEFYAGSNGFFDMSIPIEAGIISMTAKATLIPGIGIEVYGGVRIGALLYGELEIVAEVFNTKFPLTAEIWFSKFPLDVAIRMDYIVIPLTIKMRVLLTLKIPIVGRIILLSIDIFTYSMAPIKGNIFEFHTKDADPSPPLIKEFSTPVSGGRKRQADGTILPKTSQSCEVGQVPLLDWTEAAFILEVESADDKSLVKFYYCVGTSVGACDVINEDEYSGPSAVIEHQLKGGVPLFFKVIIRNSQGSESYATCSMPNYDTTLPVGRIDIMSKSTSNPTSIKGSAVVHDDSEIMQTFEGVGFGIGIWGDQIVPFTDAMLNSRVIDPANMEILEMFTGAKLGRLLTNSILSETSGVIRPVFCAQMCLLNDQCLSFNFDYGPSATCELLGDLERKGVEIHEDGYFIHQERLGTGNAVQFDHSDVYLIHNNLYYINLHLINYVGYEEMLHSYPVLADFTPPFPGVIENASRDEMVHEECQEYVPEEWRVGRCFTGADHTMLLNHRWIIDGDGSYTVFNGYEDLTDMLYTRANTYIAANWDFIHDNETGIFGYTWAVGEEICGTEVSDAHRDPHAHLFDESEWSHEGLVINLMLPDGWYYITVRAINKVDFGSPMALSICHTTPYVIDNTPPLAKAVYNVTYDTEQSLIGASVNACDPHSLIWAVDIALGRSPRDTYHFGWMRYTDIDPEGLVYHFVVNFTIPDGIPAWVKMRAVNNVDLRNSTHADSPILVDRSSPFAGEVFDGDFSAHDLVYTKERRKICGNWQNFYDPESGISSYTWGVGTSVGLDDIVLFTNLTRYNHKMCSDALKLDEELDVTLQHKQTYYSTVIATNGGLDKLTVSASSDGVLCDLTPPEAGQVYDGILYDEDDMTTLVDEVYSSKPATVAGQWENFVDPESDIDDFEVSVWRKHADTVNESFQFEEIHALESVGKDASMVEWHHFNLQHKDMVKFNLRTTNGAQDYVDVGSSGVLIDLTPPKLVQIGDGPVYGSDIEYQSHTDSLSVNWEFDDPESGIILYEVAYFEIRQGTKHKIYPNDGQHDSTIPIEDVSTNTHTQGSLSLQSGSVYVGVIKATDGALLISSEQTTAVRVNETPPEMIYVRAGILDGETEEIVNGYVYQSDTENIAASWLGVDGESGIAEYFVSVGTTEFGTDIQDFQSIGEGIADFITGLSLLVTDPLSCDDTMFTPGCAPVYYVCAKAMNKAGAFSTVKCSSPIRIVEEDRAGYVIDGAYGPDSETATNTDILESDIDVQIETTTVTAHFVGFSSHLYGICHYLWSVGTAPGVEDIQPFTPDGIVLNNDFLGLGGPGLSGSGKAQSPLPLEHGKKYCTTVRAITGNDDVLQSTSDCFTVDNTPPNIEFVDLGFNTTHEEQLYLSSGQPLYKIEDNLLAIWDVADDKSPVVLTGYQTGQYPGGDDIIGITPTDINDIPASAESLQPEGVSNLLTLTAINEVGLRSYITSVPMVVDSTPPSEGRVECPDFIHSRGILQCSWSLFLDAESPVVAYQVFLGTLEGFKDVFTSEMLPRTTENYSIKSTDVGLMAEQSYFMTVEATNAVDMVTPGYSQRIVIDDTPPISGLVIELDGVHVINGTDPPVHDQPADCTLDEDCMSFDAICIPVGPMPQVAILWQPFIDEETGIAKYEVALGTSPGGFQIVPFTKVSSDTTTYIFKLMEADLNKVRKVYATVRAYNHAGLASTSTSNGAHPSRVLAGRSPWVPFTVFDGPNKEYDLDYTISLNDMSASWDFSGDACPWEKFEWAIYRIDGLVLQEMTDAGAQTSGENDELEMTNLQSMYVVVRATNVLGLTFIVRSDGVRIELDPLVPGFVYDGYLPCFDLSSQVALNKIWANWKGFGRSQESEEPEHTGNDELPEPAAGQEVQFYIVSVGSDRRYYNTRNDVVLETLVGTDTSVVFEHLDLTPGGTYYVTVRAVSTSSAVAIVTSNGITAGLNADIMPGEITVSEWVGSLSHIIVSWSDFETELDLFMYHVGIGSIANQDAAMDVQCKYIIANWVDPSTLASIYDVYPMTQVGKNTLLDTATLSMIQNQEYFVTVIGVNEGGECNVTMETFKVDVTPPIEGQIRTGPFFGLLVSYTKSDRALQVWWEGYIDNESGIKSYSLQLLQSPACGDDAIADRQVVVDWTERLHNETTYEFFDLELEEHIPYYVFFRAENHADHITETWSPPVLLDNARPRPGLVVDGDDFREDITNHGFTDWISGTFLHMAEPEGVPCPMEDLAFGATSEWDYIKTIGLWNVEQPKKWKKKLKHDKDQVTVGVNNMDITLQRDTRKERMLTGAYGTSARMGSKGGEYELDIKAAAMVGDVTDPILEAVTSIIFWDGPRGVVGDYSEPPYDDWKEQLCSCCYDDPIDEVLCDYCNCTEHLALNPDPPPPPVEQPEDEPEDDSGVTVISPDEEAELALLADPKEKYRRQQACGIQLNAAGVNDSYVTLWCTYYVDFAPREQSQALLSFDPSEDWHNYKIKIVVTPADATRYQWTFDLYADDEFVVSLDGIPELSPDTRMIYHVFSKDNHVPDLGDPFFPPTATASFRNLRMPASESSLCRYGLPFRGGETIPIVKYLAGIGSSRLDFEDDVEPFREVYAPCVPCIHACDTYVCDMDCSRSDYIPVTFTLTGINLAINESLPDGTTRYFIKVCVVTGNGEEDYSVSSGVFMDTTPPVKVVFYYNDIELSEFEPVTAQSSRSTIKIGFSFNDTESEIKDSQWAIGTSPGGTDIQGFVSVGGNLTARNDDLEGILQNGQTYYVTMKVANAARLEEIFQEPGIEVLTDPPSVDGMSFGPTGSEDFGNPNIPAKTKKAKSATSTGTCWVHNGNPGIKWFQYCVGSSNTIEDDIVPCTAVGDDSGCAEIKNGMFTVTLDDGQTESFALAEFKIVDFNRTYDANSEFYMEPGKCLHHTLKACNRAQLCTALTGKTTTTVIGDSDEMVTSSDGSDISVNGVTSGRRRRKRAVDPQFDFSAETTGGTTVGQTLLVGTLSEADVTQMFVSDMTEDFTQYICDPDITLPMFVSRELKSRVSNVKKPSFYMSSLGQLEFLDKLRLTIAINGGEDVGDTPRLLYYEPDQKEWMDASLTCGPTSTLSYNPSTMVLTVELCGTRGGYPSSSTRKKRATPTFFTQETQFVVAATSDTIANDPPQSTNVPAGLTIEQGGGTLSYQLDATDADGDSFTFSLDPAVPQQFGTATVNPDGTFSYVPCDRCSGVDVVSVKITKESSFPGQTVLTTTESFSITVSNGNTHPIIFAAHYGRVLAGTVSVDENSADLPRPYQIRLDIGAFDYEADDVLTLSMVPATNGQTSLGNQDRRIPNKVPNCQSKVETHRKIPCDLALPDEKDTFSWVMSTIFYQPNNGFTGLDSIRLLATDSNGALSQLFILNIDVTSQTKLSWRLTEYSAYEYDGSVTLTIDRTGFLGRITYVDVTTVDMVAVSTGSVADYTAHQSTVQFGLEESEKTVTIGIVNDDELELGANLEQNPETFKVVLSNVLNGHANVPYEAVVNIHDDDSWYKMKHETYAVAEIDKELKVYVERVGYQGNRGEVTLMTTNIEADDSDYTLTNPTIEFEPDVSDGFVTIQIIEDEEEEDPEQFVVSFESTSMGSVPLHPVQSTVTITNSVPDTTGQGTASLFTSTVTLPNLSSAAFSQLEDHFIESMESVLSQVAGEQYVTIVGYTETADGVEVEFSITSIGNDDESALLQTINNAIATGSLGNLEVDTTPVELTPGESEPVLVLSTSLTLPDVTYTPALADPSSPEYIQMVAELEQAIEETFADTSGEQTITNVQFVPNGLGGVTVTFDIISVGEDVEETLVTVLQTEVDSGQLGSITVEPEEVVVEPGELPGGEEGTDGGQTGEGTASVFTSTITLPNLDSAAFSQLENDFTVSMESLFTEVTGEQIITILGFTETADGVEVEFSITSIGNDDESALLQTINNAIATGSLGNLEVDTSPVELTPGESEPVLVLSTSLTLPDTTYTPALADPSSPEYIQMVAELEQAIEETFADTSGTQTITNVQFVPDGLGGVTVTFDIVSVGGDVEETLVTVLQTEVDSGHLGSITVEPEEVVVQPGTIPGSDGGTDGGTGGSGGDDGTGGDGGGGTPVTALLFGSVITLASTPYTAELANPNSQRYVELVQQLTTALEDIYTDTPGSQYVTILEFNEANDGTVEVVFELTTVGFDDTQVLQEILTNAVASGQLESFSVSPEAPEWEQGAEEPVTQHRSSLNLGDTPFDPALTDPTSAEYQALAAQIREPIEALYRSLPGFQYITDIIFLPSDSGGVEVIFDLSSINTPSDEQLFTVLQDVVNEGVLGDLSVVQQDLEWVPINNRGSGSTNSIYAFLPTEYTVYKADQHVTVVITRTGDTSVRGSVRLYTVNGIAQISQDVERMDTTVYFEPGESINTVEVVIINDNEAEHMESFGLRLSEPSAGHVEISTSTAQVTIVDDDSSFMFESSRYFVNEGAGSIDIAIIRKGETKGAASIEIVAVGDGATLGMDFVFSPTRIEFAHGDVRKTVSVVIVDDDVIEPTEDIKCLLSNPRGGKTTIGIPHEARILVEDNDGTFQDPDGDPDDDIRIPGVEDSTNSDFVIGISTAVGAAILIALSITIAIYLKKRHDLQTKPNQDLSLVPRDAFYSSPEEDVLMTRDNFILMNQIDAQRFAQSRELPGTSNPNYLQYY